VFVELTPAEDDISANGIEPHYDLSLAARRLPAQGRLGIVNPALAILCLSIPKMFPGCSGTRSGNEVVANESKTF
jgi:hypothetical protein